LFDHLVEYQERLTEFWDDDMKGIAEAEVLAHLAGAVECTDFTQFRDRCERALRSGSLDLELDLMSETSFEESARFRRTRRELFQLVERSLGGRMPLVGNDRNSLPAFGHR
jgi:hypothetical protein